MSAGPEPAVKRIVIGDNHTGALERGRNALIRAGRGAAAGQIAVRPPGSAALAGQHFFADRDDHVEITPPEYRERLDRLPIPGMERARIGLCLPFVPSRVIRALESEARRFSPLAPGWTRSPTRCAGVLCWRTSGS